MTVPGEYSTVYLQIAPRARAGAQHPRPARVLDLLQPPQERAARPPRRPLRRRRRPLEGAAAALHPRLAARLPRAAGQLSDGRARCSDRSQGRRARRRRAGPRARQAAPRATAAQGRPRHHRDRSSAVAIAVLLLPALIVAVLFGGAQQNTACAADSALPGSVDGPGSLGGVAGTGVSTAELAAARRIRGVGGTRLTPGVYSPTAYFPHPNAPSTNCAATCISTASGIRVNNATRRAYLIASNPRLNQYGALAYIWPNPYGWTGPFVVADTGSDFNGAGRLDFYIFMARGRELAAGARPRLPVGARQPGQAVRRTDPRRRPDDLDVAAGARTRRTSGPAARRHRSAARPARRSTSGRCSTSATRSPSAAARRSRASSTGGPSRRSRRATARAARASRSCAASRDVPRTLVVQLGTNDTDVRRFRANVRSVLAIARRASARVLWVNVARPVLDGTRDTRAQRGPDRGERAPRRAAGARLEGRRHQRPRPARRRRAPVRRRLFHSCAADRRRARRQRRRRRPPAAVATPSRPARSASSAGPRSRSSTASCSTRTITASPA